MSGIAGVSAAIPLSGTAVRYRVYSLMAVFGFRL